MNYEAFLTEFYKEILPNKPDFIRKGQALMNFLNKLWPEEYRRITTNYYHNKNEIDCFYKDELIPNTLTHLSEQWPD